jgi:SAM-dependent methyltransferase
MQETSAGSIVTEGGALDPVQAQYERWVYPRRAYDLSALPLTAPVWHFDDTRSLYHLFWPRAPYREDLDILIAGCGSLSAAAQAYLFPKARVVGIDISRTSLEHEEFLKNKHNLSNLTLRHMRLEEAASLGSSFDFIICYGVLHHIVEPTAGLRILGQMLKPDGVIDILVYGRYGRLGVTLLQELFRLLQLEQDPAGVQVVKDTLRALPPPHPVQHYLRMARHDLSTDEGLVDTFLHRRDTPFSVAEVLKFVEDAGLVFQGWKENGLYHLDARLSSEDPLSPHLQGLDDRRLWQAVEMLDATIAGHWFHVCRTDRDPATYAIQFDNDAFLGYIPVARSELTAADRLRRKPATLARPPFPPIALSDEQAAVVSNFNGTRTVRECLAAGGITESPEGTKMLRGFFKTLWRAGYVMFRLA